MRVLITGGAGFIGSHVADRLLKAGHDVRALDSLEPQVHTSGVPTYLDPSVELIEGDVRDRELVRKSLADIDAVAHLASLVGVGQSMYEIERYISGNVLGTAVLMEEIIARRDHIKKVVVASSMSCYGEGQYRYAKRKDGFVSPQIRPVDQLARREWEVRAEDGEVLEPVPTSEDKPFQPTSVYAISKRDQEELVLTSCLAYGIGAVGLRFFNTYGTRQSLDNPYTGVAAIFASRLLNQKPPLIFEDGNQSRDFVDVRDVAQAVELALTKEDADGLALNVGTGSPTTINQIAALLTDGLSLDIEPQITGQFRAGDIRHCYADIGRARSILGFSPQIELRQGMQDLLEWLEGQPAKDLVEAAHEALLSRGLAR